MGLSTKLVSIDDHELDNWTCSSQNSLPEPPSLPPKPEPLKCPRCGSINTKFCYYNNYNKSQPRHYCKGCKRHWTEGGTLRNVPVGGGRKKRLRSTDLIDHITGRKHVNDQKNPLISTAVTSTTIPQDGNTHFSLIPNFNTQSSNVYYNEYMGKFDSTTMEESTVTTVMPITSSSDLFSHQPWHVPEASNDLINENMSSTYWNWNEFDTLSAADLNIPWDDLDIKP